MYLLELTVESDEGDDCLWAVLMVSRKEEGEMIDILEFEDPMQSAGNKTAIGIVRTWWDT